MLKTSPTEIQSFYANVYKPNRVNSFSQFIDTVDTQVGEALIKLGKEVAKMGWKRGYGIPGTRHAVSAEELGNRLINIGRLLKSGERMLTAYLQRRREY